jgi:hypothetical protein
MKIRMKDNSLRLRLSQTEVTHFHRHGEVKSTTRLGSDGSLTYALIVSKDQEVISASFRENEIRVNVPEKIATEWALTEQVGFDEEMPLGGEEKLFILVEKDFRCLQERPHEDESDAFPNPFEGSVC